MRILLLSILLATSICFPVSAGRTVTDVWNRDVVIPDEVDSIIAIGPMGPRMAAYLDVVDMLAGAEDSDIREESVRYDYSPVFHDELAVLPSVGTGGGSGGNNAYAEEIIMLQPDVILAGFNADACDELQRQTGIPVVSIRYRTQGFIDEGFYRSLRLFADVVGAQERCEEVLSYIDSCKADLDARTCDVPDDRKLRAYTGAVTFNGRHGFAFTYVSFPPFDAVNAVNVADVLRDEKTGQASAYALRTGTAYIGDDGFEAEPGQCRVCCESCLFRFAPCRARRPGIYHAFIQFSRAEHHVPADECLLCRFRTVPGGVQRCKLPHEGSGDHGDDARRGFPRGDGSRRPLLRPDQDRGVMQR